MLKVIGLTHVEKNIVNVLTVHYTIVI